MTSQAESVKLEELTLRIGKPGGALPLGEPACIPVCPGLSQYRELATGISLKGAQVTAFTVAFSGRGKGNWYGWNDKNESKWNPLKDNEKPQGLPLTGLTLRCMNQAGGNPGKTLLWYLFLIDFFEQSLPKFRHPLLRGR